MCIIEGTKSFVVSRSICNKLDMQVVSRRGDISWKFFATEGFNFSFSTIGHFNVIVRAQDIGVVFYIKLKRNESLIRMNHRIVRFIGWTTQWMKGQHCYFKKWYRRAWSRFESEVSEILGNNFYLVSWPWRWRPHRLSKPQSTTTVLPRTSFIRVIMQITWSCFLILMIEEATFTSSKGKASTGFMYGMMIG